MIIIPPCATLHYKCAFDIYNDDDMSKVRKILFDWLIKKKIGKPYTFSIYDTKRFFYNGNDNFDTIKHVQIRTALATVEKIPRAWGMEVIHQDSEFKMRYWSIEVTLKKEEESVRFVATIKHFLIPYYIGPEFISPVATTPRFIVDILQDEEIICKKGNTSILANPMKIKKNRTQNVVLDIYQNLNSPERQIPFIFISRNKSSETAFDFQNLSKKICGNANVYFFEDEAAIDELNFYIGDFKQFYYNIGEIGCYLPDIAFSDLRTITQYRRHGKHNPIASDDIVNGVSRYLKTRPNDFDTLRSIIAERRTIQFQELHKNHTETVQMQKLYSTEYDSLEEQNKELKHYNSELEEVLDDTDTKLTNSQRENKELQYRYDSLLNEYTQVNTERTRLLQLKELLPQYVKTLEDQLQIFAKLYADKIIVLPEAYDSAKEYSLWNKFDISREMLFSVVNILYPLLFPVEEHSVGNIEKVYNESCRFKLALKEGMMTNADKKFQSMRKRIYNGIKIDITPHIAYGNHSPDLLRMYFYPDNKGKKIIIGHFGTHLDNFSTKKATK